MRYGALRSSCLGVGRGCSSQPRGAASRCAASAHSITVAPAPTVTSPMPRTTGFVLSFRATRSPSRDSSNGTTACIATAPSVQTSMPTARGMRFTPESMAASKPSRAGVSTHPGPLSPDQLARPPTVGKRPFSPLQAFTHKRAMDAELRHQGRRRIRWLAGEEGQQDMPGRRSPSLRASPLIDGAEEDIPGGGSQRWALARRREVREAEAPDIEAD